MDTPKLVCKNCKQKFSAGYIVKQLDTHTELVEDLCRWCAVGTQPPIHRDTGDFGRGLSGMRERDYE